jgi:hypothetical protein
MVSSAALASPNRCWRVKHERTNDLKSLKTRNRHGLKDGWRSNTYGAQKELYPRCRYRLLELSKSAIPGFSAPGEAIPGDTVLGGKELDHDAL